MYYTNQITFLFLNFRSLRAHLLDVLSDKTLLEADVICLQETWSLRSDPVPSIPGYKCYLAGEGKGKGVAIFIKSHFVEGKKHLRVNSLGNKDNLQGLKLYFEDLHILNIYRPPNHTSIADVEDFMNIMKQNIDPHKQTLVCGDFNINFLKEPRHKISTLLKDLGFQQIVRHPTTIYGSCLDHVYLRTNVLHRCRLHYPYYSDHECVCIMLKKQIHK